MANPLIEFLLALDDETRRNVLDGLTDAERSTIQAITDDANGNPYARYRNDHFGFVKHGLGEGTWSKQDEVLRAVDKYRKVAVVATHSIGKSHISARVVLGTGLTWPPGLSRITTTATNYRQVTNILWPYIRRTHKQYRLPGEVMGSPQWKMEDELIADGFSAAASDETAVQGMHANGEFLLVVDEAGGISDTLGTAFNSLLTSENAHALVIGNAPTEREGSWFQRICEGGDWHVIKISAFDTPNFPRPHGKSLTKIADVQRWLRKAEQEPDNPVVRNMFEVPDWCTTCPPSIGKHRVSKHLTDLQFAIDVAREYGEDSPYYIARVLADFPKNVATKTLPGEWLDAATVPDDTEWPVKPVRLGVDIASDGGDELAIAWAQGLNIRMAATANGKEISSPNHAARFILDQIQLAEQYHEKHGIDVPVSVKYDAIGIGWGMGGILREYKDQGRHNAELVPVNVAENAAEPEKYRNIRAELWWSFREWIEPNATGDTLGQLKIGERERAQLNGPMYFVKNGRIQIEAKEDMKKRGQRSPDRAEAILLAVYEPPRHRVAVPIFHDHDTEPLLASNPWDFMTQPMDGANAGEKGFRLPEV